MSTASTSRVNSLARIYAASLFELAEVDGGLPNCETTGLELGEVAAAAQAEPSFREFLRSPVVSTADKEATLRRIFGDGRVSDLLLRFLLVLNKKGRLDQVSGIGEAYTQLLWERTGRVEVDVFSAEPLDEDLAEIVRRRIGEALGKEAVLRSNVDADLIGGLKLRVGDRMIDASVATRLGRIRETLNTSGAEAVRSRAMAMMQD
jgi:F-type H+-transporting ATPase subunit delta